MRSRATIVGLLLLLGPVIPAQARVTGIKIDPKHPKLGDSVTLSAIDDGEHEVAELRWTYALSDGEAIGRPVTISPNRQTELMLDFGGTYTIKLKVVYGGAAPPPPETFSTKFEIPRPDAIEEIEGLDQPLPYMSPAIASTIRYWVLAEDATTGKYLSGSARRRIRNRVRWDGKKEPDRPWEPEFPGNLLSQNQGVIRDLVVLRIDREDWDKLRPGQTVMSWDEDFRLDYWLGSSVWTKEDVRLGKVTRHGKLIMFHCPLGTRHLSIVKFDAERWIIRQRSGDEVKKESKSKDAGQGPKNAARQ